MYRDTKLQTEDQHRSDSNQDAGYFGIFVSLISYILINMSYTLIYQQKLSVKTAVKIKCNVEVPFFSKFRFLTIQNRHLNFH